MKSKIDIVIVECEGGIYLGWAKDFTAVVVQKPSKEEVVEGILRGLKVLFSHFIDKIDDGTIETEIVTSVKSPFYKDYELKG